MILSVVDQTYRSWELILVDDASPDPRVGEELRLWSSRDQRINSIHRIKNGNISIATNDAADASKGEFLVFLDHDDLLDPDACAHLALHLDAHPETDLIYSDDDKIGADGVHHSPQFKPDWSPELLLTFCYTAHLSAVSARLYRELGGLRVGFEGSQDHDFWLRAGERARHVGHVAQVLYHWRVLPGSTATNGNCKPASFDAGRRAVEEAFARRGVPCPVRRPDWAVRAGCAIFEPVMPDDGPSVAILIPTCNHKFRLNHLLESLAKTTYQSYRVYVIDNESDDASTLRYLASLPHHVVHVPNPGGEFSFAAINNAAAAMVTEDLLLFLNDDIEVINPRWLSQMVGWSRLPGVGAVGARLLYGDRTIQHAGIVHGFHDGPAGLLSAISPWWEPGYWNFAHLAQLPGRHGGMYAHAENVVYRARGVRQQRFPVAYNDADYGYRLGDAGYRCVYCARRNSITMKDSPAVVATIPAAWPCTVRSMAGGLIRTSVHISIRSSKIFEARPTVVPVGGVGRPVSILAVTHNLNWEGYPGSSSSYCRG